MQYFIVVGFFSMTFDLKIGRQEVDEDRHADLVDDILVGRFEHGVHHVVGAWTRFGDAT